MKHAPKTVFGETCPPKGFYVTWDSLSGEGPFDIVDEAIDHLAEFVCHDYTTPELLKGVVVESDGTTLGLAKSGSLVIDGKWVREHLQGNPNTTADGGRALCGVQHVGAIARSN